MGCCRRKKKSEDSDEKLLEKKEEVPPASFFQLFRYASCSDILLLLIGAFVAALTGFGSPLLSVLIGDISQNFIDVETRLSNNTGDSTEIFEKFSDDVISTCLKYLYLGLLVLVVSSLEILCFMMVSENMANRLRRHFLAAVLRQEVAWFDSKQSGTFATKLFDNLERVKEGTGEKMGSLVQYSFQFIGGFIVAFARDWRLTLIMMALVPFLAICAFFLSKLMADEEKKGTENYSKAGGIAEQALTSIRTVIAFNGQEIECSRYDSALAKGTRAGLRKALVTGVGLAVTFLVLFASYCLAFWKGTNFVYEGTMEGGTVMTVFFSVMMGSMALGQAGPLLGTIASARMAAGILFDVIDRIPEIDSSSKDGLKPENLRGTIAVEDVHFAYPTRSDVQVLKGLSLEAKVGQTVALVGASGCGKSNLIQLLLRYYNPSSGKITIDGIPINKLNIDFLRNFIGVVSQEPVLFNTTIEENIRFGRQDLSLMEIEDALRKANAYDFVASFPEGLQTTVGDRGTQLSGGQKQRLAIARALVRDPKVLLLDEATSALDTESESIVQAALENASKGRTTIVIAHRLSTIRNADKIVAVKDGHVVEEGTHKELLTKKGLYFDLVNAQLIVEEKKVTTPIQSARYSRQISHETPRPNFDLKRLKSQTSTINDVSSGMDKNQIKETKEDVKRLKEELEEEGAKRASLWSIARFARPEWCYLFLALLFSSLGGMIVPAFSLFFAQILSVFSTSDKEKMLEDGHKYSMFFLALGAAEAVFAFIQTVAFALVAEKMTERMRSLVFRNVMRMDGKYFDDPLHAPGKIVTRLATDAPNVKAAVDSRLGSLFSEIVSDVCGLTIALYFGWQMAIPVIIVFSLAGVVQSLRMRYVTEKTKQAEKEMEESGKIALEAIENIRTVQALTLQEKIHQQFCEHLDGPFKTNRRKATLQGISQGLSSALFYFLFSFSFRLGLWLILEGYMQPMDVIKVMFAISFTAGGLGMISAYLPDYMKSTLAAGLIFKMTKEEPEIDQMTDGGLLPEIEGNVRFDGVFFSYPQRPETAVLQGLDIDVSPGKTLALVGASGCGKSTVIALLERLYNPHEGRIVIDETNVNEINPRHLRNHIALVSQEPILFDCSIRDNIVYGLPPGSFHEEEVKEAAEKANIHKFIEGLPDGYKTSVGDRGTQLSGGQKQRIAIARALIRKPKVLLLDEATSALDTESEKLVQDALEKASEGQAVIVIAHRLSTVTSADCIAVIVKGKVAEKGTHQELMEKRGAYWSLQQKQNGNH